MDVWVTIFTTVLGVFVLGLILIKPYIGLVVLVASLLVVDILPELPLVSSIFPVVGVVTLGAHVISQKQHTKALSSNRKIYALFILFILWVIISNPAASVLPSNDDNRIWLSTFVQLLISVWLCATIMDEPSKHIHLFVIYSMIATFSAAYAIANGGIAESFLESERSGGLAGAANSAARYFVVGIVMMYYLRLREKRKSLRFLLLIAMGTLLLGTLYTVSRTGLLLLIFAMVLLAFQHFQTQNRGQIVFVTVIGLLITWVFADNILGVFNSIVPAIRDGSDTVGVRYGLWQAGFRMWWDYPIQGVGIGQFPEKLVYYGSDLLAPKYWHKSAHNMYIQVLSETGLVGFIIFISIFITALNQLWKTTNSENDSVASLARIWLIILSIMLLGGLTKHDHYDKLLWITVGVSLVKWRESPVNGTDQKN
jgi:O-antigen ligase